MSQFQETRARRICGRPKEKPRDLKKRVFAQEMQETASLFLGTSCIVLVHKMAFKQIVSEQAVNVKLKKGADKQSCRGFDNGATIRVWDWLHHGWPKSWNP